MLELHQLSISAAAVFALSVASLHLIGIVIYRLFLHPLARYPGPLLAKITDFYSVYYAWRGDRHLDFHRCHLKYGPVFRYGPNRLSFNTHTALYAINSARANTIKGDMYQVFVSDGVDPSIFSAISPEVHSRKKRVMAHAFSEKSIKDMEEYMLIHIRNFCAKLASSSEPLNMSKWSSYLTGDILGELCFGTSWNLLTAEKNRCILEMMTSSGAFAQICACTIPLYNTIIPSIFFRRNLNERIELRKYARSQAVKRIALSQSTESSIPHRDFYHYMIEAKNPATNERLSDRELWSEAASLIIAGSDTLSLVIAATFFYLANNDSARLKVQDEVRGIFGRDAEAVVSCKSLQDCIYLRACLNETMRMTPPVPGILPRKVLTGGIIIDDHVIQEGVEVAVPIYALHHNKRYFPDADIYRPERWVHTSKESGEKSWEKAFAPFLTGPRGCIGKNMAYLELMLVMARVLVMFDFEDVGVKTNRTEFVVEDFFVSKKDGPMIRIAKA